MTSWARPGVRCFCVDASFAGAAPDVLVEKAIYTVRAVIEDDGRRSRTYRDETFGVVLAEVHNPNHDRGAFALARFRPLITQEDDVRLIKSLLVGDEVAA